MTGSDINQTVTSEATHIVNPSSTAADTINLFSTNLFAELKPP
jgi:hypothetical protein